MEHFDWSGAFLTWFSRATSCYFTDSLAPLSPLSIWYDLMRALPSGSRENALVFFSFRRPFLSFLFFLVSFPPPTKWYSHESLTLSASSPASPRHGLPEAESLKWRAFLLIFESLVCVLIRQLGETYKHLGLLAGSVIYFFYKVVTADLTLSTEGADYATIEAAFSGQLG